MGTIALIVGIIAVVSLFTPKLKLWTLLLGIAAVIIGIFGKATLGWIGAILGAVAIILTFILFKKKKEPSKIA